MPVETPLAAIKRAGFNGKMTDITITDDEFQQFIIYAERYAIGRCLAHVEKKTKDARLYAALSIGNTALNSCSGGLILWVSG